MSAQGTWSKLRHWLRAKLGRARLARIEERLMETHRYLVALELPEHLARMEEALAELETRLGDTGERVATIEERLERRTQERRQLGQHLLDAVGRIEQDRLEVATNLERFREVLEEGPRVLATLDNRILRYCEITDRVDDGLGRLHTAIREVSAHVERRHAEWAGTWQDVRAELDRTEALEALEGERDALDRKVRALADQCAHVIDVLGQTRRQMHDLREKADQVDETRAEKAGLERELTAARGEVDGVREDLREALRAAESLERVRESLQLELKRVQAQRDRLLTGVPPAAVDGRSGAGEGS